MDLRAFSMTANLLLTLREAGPTIRPGPIDTKAGAHVPTLLWWTVQSDGGHMPPEGLEV